VSQKSGFFVVTSYIVHSPPRVLPANALVRELIDHDSDWWNVSLMKEIFNAEEVKAIMSIPLSTFNHLDIPIWRGTANGVFTVGSAYHLAKEWDCREHAETSTCGKEIITWRGICSMQLPIVAKNFMWRAYQDLLPTKDNLVDPTKNYPKSGMPFVRSGG
jgi:hypothetical protein